ncbi:MAG: hypothetical protein ACLP50_24950, partial [Solirubrobacteraceae bacterium]
ERKAKFITQVMRGRLDLRSIEDIGDNALSFQEVKALASGDPLILEKATADADLTRLQRLQRAWQRNHNALRHTITSAQDRVGVCDQQLDAIADALAQRRDTRGERFAMTIAERTVQTRPDAARLLAVWARGAVPGKPAPVAQLGGIEIVGVVHRDLATREQLVKLALHGLPTQPATLDLSQLQDSALSLVRQLEHRIGDLGGLAERIQAQKAGVLGEAGAARDALARPFKYTAELADTQARVQRIADEMRSRQEQPEASGDRGDERPGPAEPDELADIRQLARASFPSAPTPAPPASTPGRATPRDPERRERSLER